MDSLNGERWLIFLVVIIIYNLNSVSSNQCQDKAATLVDVTSHKKGSYDYMCRNFASNSYNHPHYRNIKHNCKQISPVDQFKCGNKGQNCGFELVNFLATNKKNFVCKNTRDEIKDVESSCFHKDKIGNGTLKSLTHICITPNNINRENNIIVGVGSNCRTVGSNWKHSETYVSSKCIDISNYIICDKTGKQCLSKSKYLCSSKGQDVPKDYVICVDYQMEDSDCENVRWMNLNYKCTTSKKGCLQFINGKQKVYFEGDSPPKIKVENQKYICSRGGNACEKTDRAVNYVCPRCDNGGTLVDLGDSEDENYGLCKDNSKTKWKRNCIKVSELDEFHCNKYRALCVHAIRDIATKIQKYSNQYLCKVQSFEGSKCEEITKNVKLREICIAPTGQTIPNVATNCTPVPPKLNYRNSLPSSKKQRSKYTKSCIKINGQLCDVNGCYKDVKYLCDLDYSKEYLPFTTTTMKVCTGKVLNFITAGRYSGDKVVKFRYSENGRNEKTHLSSNSITEERPGISSTLTPIKWMIVLLAVMKMVWF